MGIWLGMERRPVWVPFYLECRMILKTSKEGCSRFHQLSHGLSHQKGKGICGHSYRQVNHGTTSFNIFFFLRLNTCWCLSCLSQGVKVHCQSIYLMSLSFAESVPQQHPSLRLFWSQQFQTPSYLSFIYCLQQFLGSSKMMGIWDMNVTQNTVGLSTLECQREGMAMG